MKRALKTLLTLAIITALGLAARHWLISTVRIAGTSMENTLMSGDIALVLRTDKSTAFGDVIECTFPGRNGSYVKRVTGLSGDVIEYSGGRLFRNGTPVSEPYVSSATGDFSAEVPIGSLFVMGDNRTESYDSRASDMGCIAQENVLGSVKWILWPLDRFGPVD